MFTSEYYKRFSFNERLGGWHQFRSFVPAQSAGAAAESRVSHQRYGFTAVLNPATVLNSGFDSYRLMPKHNDMRAMVRQMRFQDDQPSFHLLNVGETHYPYALPDEPEDQWPRISGVHGVFKHLDEAIVGGKLRRGRTKMFDNRKLAKLRDRQIEAVKYLDTVVEELF
jgi:hypothetical protein